MGIPLPLKIAINRALARLGYQMNRLEPAAAGPADAPPPGSVDVQFAFDEAEWAVFHRAKPYTMLSPAAILSLRDAVTYVIKRDIPGAFIECGCWKGGASMTMANTLLELGASGRHLYIYDNFEGGWPPATEADEMIGGLKPHACYEKAIADGLTWDDITGQFEGVQRLIASTGYPDAHTHIVKGLVEETIPAEAPDEIAVLRLDTDWYESTKHELEHLYPRLSPGGVLIIDDYGSWSGSRKATDEYFAEHGIAMLLHRVDLGCRIGLKA